MNEPDERLVELLADCYDDPDLFNSAILGGPDFEPHQVEWCHAVVSSRRLVLVTGNAVGKDFWIARIILWWLSTRTNSLVIVTGPSQTLLGSVTWKEVRRAVEQATIPLGAKVSEGVKASPQTVNLGGGRQALGYSTTSVERASGQHAAHVLVVAEEASAIEPDVWDALDSLKAEKLVAIGNPLRAEGGFIDLVNQAAEDERAGVPSGERVVALHMPSTASPHANLDHSPCGLADRVWLAEQARTHGVESLWYRSHVLAIVPSQSHDALLRPEDLDRCTSHATRLEAEELRRTTVRRPRIGCDVGEGVGNARSVVFCVDDHGVIECEASAFKGPSDTAETIARMAVRRGVAARDVSYDGAGVTGKRLGNALASKGLAEARPYFGSGSGGKRFTNLRSACAAAFAARIDPRHYDPLRQATFPRRPYHIPPGPDWAALREELLGLRYELAGDKTQLENKADFMDRLGRSPDYADGLLLTFRSEAVRG